MSLGRTYAVGLVGLAGHIVEVQADIGQELPSFVLLGLPDASLNEAKDRVRSAARNVGLPLARRKLTVNLTPASLPKRGTSFDLAIIVASWQADRKVRMSGDVVFLAELGLDGQLLPVAGVLPAVMAAVAAGYSRFVVASENHAEASLVTGAEVRAFDDVAAVALFLGAKEADVRPVTITDRAQSGAVGDTAAVVEEGDIADVHGQPEAKLALEVAAAGGHHLMLVGPPGAGKTMLASRLTGLLPDLDDQASLEVSAIHSLVGSGGKGVRAGFAARGTLLRRPHFEAPHHSATVASIVGGGSGIPLPGAISKAHRGVLFLDEAPEFDRRVLDSLRQPLESGQLSLHRSAGVAKYPARFQLVLAANPCPCGNGGGKAVDCTCTWQQRRRYFGKISGPVLDRVDLHVTVDKVNPRLFREGEQGESSAVVAQRVSAARALQKERLAAFGYDSNAHIPGPILRGALRLPPEVTALLDGALERGRLSARAYDKVLRIAWTLADLEGGERPGEQHVAQALTFRSSHGGGEG